MSNNKNIQTNSNPYQSLEQIHQGIEDYFECRLSEQQERLLRQSVATNRYRTPQIEECIAVMGFKPAPEKVAVINNTESPHLCGQVHIGSKRTRRAWFEVVAASIVLAILFALPRLVSSGVSESISSSDCYAYVSGKKITDQDVIMRMLMEDFDEFDQSMTQINDDFDSAMEYLSQIIEENENPL